MFSLVISKLIDEIKIRSGKYKGTINLSNNSLYVSLGLLLLQFKIFFLIEV